MTDQQNKRTEWKIVAIDDGWWLFLNGWHVYHSNWFPIYKTLDDVFAKIKERQE